MQHRLGMLATALFAFVVPSAGRGQAAPASKCSTYQPAPTSSTGVPDPKDVANENAIIATLYDVISGPACQRRDWNRFVCAQRVVGECESQRSVLLAPVESLGADARRSSRVVDDARYTAARKLDGRCAFARRPFFDRASGGSV